MKIQRWQLGLIAVLASVGGIILPSGKSSLAPAPLQVASLQQISTPDCPLTCLGLDEQLWRKGQHPGDRAALITAIDNSLRYLSTPAAQGVYRNYPVSGISQERVQQSLKRFRQLLLNSRSPEALQQAVQREFRLYQSIGKDNQGTVAFTGYFQPVYAASRIPTTQFRYPLYRLPANFDQWPSPPPARAELEGIDGLQGTKGRLKGLELVWLRDRLEAFLVQVQGSARLRLTDGRIMTVGFAGRTRYPYTSIGKELVKDGKIRQEDLTLPALKAYFGQYPEELNRYLPRNQSFVFFRTTSSDAPRGSLNVPVTPERSIATDRSLMPAGALALVQTQMPFRGAAGQVQYQLVNRYVLDQDTGSAIKGPGRVDIFMGTGPQAGDRAGLINHSGRLYYLLLK
jgi:membrane-bound lytic murein transglycosylase A